MQGLKINGKDVPLSGRTLDFIARPSEGRVLSCPELDATTGQSLPLPSLYILIGASFGSLVLISIMVLVTCKTVHFFHNRKKQRLSVSRRAQSFIFTPQTDRFTNRSFDTPDGDLTNSRNTQNHLTHELQNSTLQTPPSPTPSIPTVTETALNDPPYAVIPDKPSPKKSSSPKRRMDTPVMFNPTKENSPQQQRVRHGSQNSVSSLGTSTLQDRQEIAQFVSTRVKAVNKGLPDINYDEMSLFIDEGPFENMRTSSVASLHAILDDFEAEQTLTPITVTRPTKESEFVVAGNVKPTRHKQKQPLVPEPPPNYEEMKQLMRRFQKLTGDNDIIETRLV